MAVASPVDTLVNPNDATQYYILWGNGRIDAVGGLTPITGQDTWYDFIEQPIVVALWISNWTTGAGYMLDLNGGFHPLNGASTAGWTAPASGYSHYTVPGVPYVGPQRMYVDWAWNPAGNGQGFVLDQYGQTYPFGGATPLPRTGPKWPWPAALKLQMRFTPDVRGVIMDVRGGLHGEGATTSFGSIGTYWADANNARDFVVTDWTAPSGYKLDLFGGVHAFGTNGAPWGYPYLTSADVGRTLSVLSASNPLKMLEVWSGGQQYQFVSSTAPSVTAGGGTSEIQQVKITGSPTGGSFTLTYSAQTTAAIAFNATATTVQTALRALAAIGSTGVTVTGGPGPGTPWLVTFAGSLANTDVAQMTATSSLTGGTTPAVTVTTSTAGVLPSPAPTTTTTTRPVLSWIYSDPQGDSQAAWELYLFTQTFVTGHTMTDPSVWASGAVDYQSGINPNTRGVAPSVDLTNTSYRFYVRTQDSAGLWSAWSNFGWTQNVPLPVTPTGLTATANQTTFKVALSVTATTGGSANLIRFECSDDAGVTWQPVRGADAVTLAATTTATDHDARQGVARQYRAVAYAVDPAVASVPSATASATITVTGRHIVTAVDDPTLGGAVNVQNLIEWTRPIVAGVFQGLGTDYPTVVSDGPPKSRRGSLQLVALDAASWSLIENLLEADSVLLHRDPLGHGVYFRAVGDWTQGRLAPMQEIYGSAVPLVEVRPPQDA